MVFITPVWKKNINSDSNDAEYLQLNEVTLLMRKTLGPFKRISYLFLMFLLLRFSVAHAENEFVIKSVNTQLNGTVYFLNAVFEINLPDYIVSSVEQGLVLPLAMEIKISRNRWFWFDDDVVTIRQQYRIQYHALLDSVSLLNINSGNRLYFSTLKDTLNQLTVLLNYPLLDNYSLSQGEYYQARLSFGIDNTELSIPLKSSSFWKNNWNISSDWYEWNITQ